MFNSQGNNFLQLYFYLPYVQHQCSIIIISVISRYHFVCQAVYVVHVYGATFTIIEHLVLMMVLVSWIKRCALT